MAIFPTNNAPVAGTGRPQRPNVFGAMPAEPREQAKIWLNIGVHTADGKFINLPLGLPIDTMKFIELRGQNQEWIDLNDARNALLEALQLKGQELEPGQAVDLPGLTLQLRRVNQELAPSTAPTRASMVSDLVALLSGGAKPSQEPAGE